jgi:hypothetical protein
MEKRLSALFLQQLLEAIAAKIKVPQKITAATFIQQEVDI